jgi:phage gp36-like protein
MSYSQVEQVRDALTPGGVSGDRTTAAGLTDVQLQDAIAEADSVIDLYLSARYITPVVVDPPNNTIAFWSRSLATYLATLTRSRGKDMKDEDPVVRRQRLVMKQLEMIKAGDGQLDIPELPPSEAQNAVAVQNLYEGDLFVPDDYSLYPRPLGLGSQGIWPDIRRGI